MLTHSASCVARDQRDFGTEPFAYPSGCLSEVGSGHARAAFRESSICSSGLSVLLTSMSLFVIRQSWVRFSHKPRSPRLLTTCAVRHNSQIAHNGSHEAFIEPSELKGVKFLCLNRPQSRNSISTKLLKVSLAILSGMDLDITEPPIGLSGVARRR